MWSSHYGEWVLANPRHHLVRLKTQVKQIDKKSIGKQKGRQTYIFPTQIKSPRTTIRRRINNGK